VPPDLDAAVPRLGPFQQGGGPQNGRTAEAALDPVRDPFQPAPLLPVPEQRKLVFPVGGEAGQGNADLPYRQTVPVAVKQFPGGPVDFVGNIGRVRQRGLPVKSRRAVKIGPLGSG